MDAEQSTARDMLAGCCSSSAASTSAPGCAVANSRLREKGVLVKEASGFMIAYFGRCYHTE